jgi:uracil-DNA glycosylase family 4
MDFVLKEFDLEEQGRKISDLHGQTLKAETSFGEITFIPMYHPAATFYSSERKGELEEDFQKLKRFA